ncbi:MAG TPA: hypothetical protein VGF30_11645 [Bacteroidia bacterium]
MSRHIGNIVEKAVRKSGFPISKLAKRVGYTRQHMYNLFQQAKVDLLLVEEIGKVIGYDFAEEIVALKKYTQTENRNDITVNESVEYYVLEKKYIALLEEHNRLLKEYAGLLKKMKK